MAQYGEVRVDFITYTTGVSPTEGNATVTVSSLVNDNVFESGLVVSGNATINGDLIVHSGITTTTGIFASGTVSAPSITFTGDLDTGLYTPLPDEVGIAVNGAARAIITTTGVAFGGTGAITTPVGTSGQRPTAVEGMLRLNSEANIFEGYRNGAWRELADSSSSLNPTFETVVIQSGLTVSGNATFSSGITVSGNATFSSGIAVSGNATFSSGITATTLNVVSGIFASGAVGAPSITFSGDIDTGIYSTETNNINFATAGVERVSISESGVITAKNGAVAEIANLAWSATPTPDFASSCNFNLVLSGGTTLGNPTNATPGQTGSIFVIQDGTGNHSFAYSSNWDFINGSGFAVSGTANSVSRLDYIVRTTTSIHCVGTGPYS